MRLQLALNVPDLDQAIEFYSAMFSTRPAKVKPGYANWEVAEPPLKLVVFERPEQAPGSINHLGVETTTSDEVVAAETRLAEAGLATTGIDDTICCFAQKTETWVTDPWGGRWEWYVKQADHDDQLDNVVVAHVDTAGSTGVGGDCCA